VDLSNFASFWPPEFAISSSLFLLLALKPNLAVSMFISRPQDELERSAPRGHLHQLHPHPYNNKAVIRFVYFLLMGERVAWMVGVSSTAEPFCLYPLTGKIITELNDAFLSGN
jgi:hypothetical protein